MTASKKKLLRVILAEPDTGRRVRLREALRNVRKIETLDARSYLEIERHLEEGKFDLIAISSSFDLDTIKRLLTNLDNSPAARATPVILALRPEDRAAPFVAEMYARGIVGFICEPYSVEIIGQILDIAATAKEKPIDEKTKDKLASSFLLGDARRHLEKVVELRASGKKSEGVAGRDLRDDLSAFRETAAKLTPDELANVLLTEFSKARPKADDGRNTKKKKKRVGPASHPGEELRSLMSSRGISKEQFLSVARIPEKEFDEVLACLRPLTREMATEVARAIGRTGDYWLALQTKYNAYQEQLKEDKGLK